VWGAQEKRNQHTSSVAPRVEKVITFCNSVSFERIESVYMIRGVFITIRQGKPPVVIGIIVRHGPSFQNSA
jgi:hypothetical protein